jgi:hypothetical protein
MSIIHVTLSQGEREEVLGYITHTNLAAEQGSSFDTHWVSRAELSGVDVATLENGTNPVYVEKQAWPETKFRKATTHYRSWFPRKGQPVQSGYDFWSCPTNPEERWTPETLGYLVDSFPQILESYLYGGLDPYSVKLDTDPSLRELRKERAKDLKPHWYPTVLLNIDVKKLLPEEGVKFLFTRVQAKQIKNGRYDVEVIILDEGGDIVALSHHICLAVSAERNMAARRKGGEGTKL